MDNFTPLKTKNKKKKANKFLIIGNLLLVIIVAGIGFFYYNNTLITIRQKAQTVAEKKAEEARKKEYEESGKKDADREAKKKKEQEARRLEQEEIGGGGCPGGYTPCDVTDTGGRGHRFCIPSDGGSYGNCQNSAVQRGITVKTGGGVTGIPGGWRCVVGLGRDRPYVAGQPCVDYNSVETIGNAKVPNCFCGIIQIDNSSGGGTYESECGCNKEELAQIQSSSISTPTATPIISNTPTPTRTPTPTATRTPTPTATPIISNTPTVTPLISNTPTVTPLISNTPTVTPLISNTPGPSATPTEIILAKISTSPTVVKLLQTGAVKSFMYLIPAIIILIGLIL